MRTRLAATRFPFTTETRRALQMKTRMTAATRRQAGINNGFDTGVLGHEF